VLDRPISRRTRWFLFAGGVLALLVAGTNLGAASVGEEALAKLLRALVFLILGLFFLFMYGQSRGDRRPD